MLGPLGLSEAAEAVYRTMLGNPTWGVAQIARRLGVPEVRVRRALDELADLALLRSGEDGGQLQAVHPAVGLATLVSRVESEIMERQRQLDATRSAVATMVAEQESNGYRDSVTRLEGINAVRARLEELAHTARFECVSMNPRLSQTAEAMAASRALNEGVLRRGVQVRCVYQDSVRNLPVMVEHAGWLSAFGGEVRTAPTVPMLMIVQDRETAILPLDPADTRRGGVEVHSPAVVAAVYALFELVWSTATAITEMVSAAEHGLQPSEVELVRLLAAGHTDEASARRLGVSLRTVRRLVARLMERLDAESRFQAGVRAVQRGWL
ncbi:helix-turn-helix transcriptional regulator [Dactylosporangium sp. NBC_01737]|uniref:helix-turn-helix transcriptional regulator n=1 Tax=Dactylosporangium sp. NBC_01737 TaxID=2975959 RepID=UPI002E0E2DAD|nr:helix-turn-helix transcriptional regulator [Dactylosporangium sp. NBC_01737]